MFPLSISGMTSRINVTYQRHVSTSLTKHRPAVNEEEAVEEDNFEFEMYMRKSDGVVLTTYLDDYGVRHYVDGEDWLPIPDEWFPELEPVQVSALLPTVCAHVCSHLLYPPPQC